MFDSSGRLYGATIQYGGVYQHGVVFTMKLGSKGAWTEQVLHTFNSSW